MLHWTVAVMVSKFSGKFAVVQFWLTPLNHLNRFEEIAKFLLLTGKQVAKFAGGGVLFLLMELDELFANFLDLERLRVFGVRSSFEFRYRLTDCFRSQNEPARSYFQARVFREFGRGRWIPC